MKHVSVLSTLVLILFAAGNCQADTLVITYKSGKTQTIVLDEPSQGINSWQFIGGPAPQQQSKIPDEAPAPAQQEMVQKNSATPAETDVKAAEKAPEKKSGVRVKWNAKPIPD